MKKMYDKTCRGYYVMSVVLGLLLALAVASMMEVFVLYAQSTSLSLYDDSEMHTFFSDLWGYLPLNLCDLFWRPVARLRYLNIFMTTTTIISVGLFVGMAGGKNCKHVRAKVQQTMAVALLALFVALAYGYATRGWIENAALAAAPALATAIPWIMLKGSREPYEDKGLKEVLSDAWQRVLGACYQNKQVAIGAVVVMVCAIVLLFYVVVYAVTSYEPLFHFYGS